jgi:thioredoxin reductase/Fe-S-cluster-containing hydrogenase component 2
MEQRQVVVVGSGPAGLASAIAVAEAGARVTVLDENARPGGQLFKQIHKFFGSKEHYAGMRGFEIGTRMLKRAKDLGVEVLLNSIVYGLFEDKTLGVVRNDANLSMKAERIVLATGASENALTFPGWTLPGVMGAGGAQTMVNLHGVLPGKQCLMVGSGNVGLIVSYQLIQAGAQVVAIVEADSKVGGYEVHADKIRRMGVPILLSHTVKEARGKDSVEEVTLLRVDERWQPIPGTEGTHSVDFVCLAVGLTPLTELGSMAHCQYNYIAELGGFTLAHDENMETTVSGIYVAGDCAGVEEASIAMEQGRLVGISIAESLGLIEKPEAEKKKLEIRRRLDELRGRPVFFESPADQGKVDPPRMEIDEPPYKAGKAGPLMRGGGYPAEERFQRRPLAVIECREEIPCDPCAYVCSRGAISVGRPMTRLPRLDVEKCTGCGLCIPACPGLAIFVVDKTYSSQDALVQLPYEFRPLPKVGEQVDCLDRQGHKVAEGKVLKVSNPHGFDRTTVVSVSFDKKFADEVRAISLRRKKDGRRRRDHRLPM